MKNLLLLLSVLAVVSCGSKTQNTVNSGSGAAGGTGTTGTTGTNGLDTPAPANLVNFEGNYDIVRMDSSDCGAAIRIERLCNGYRLLSNNSNPEDFCNVNRGEMRLNGNDRNPPNPDRNPPPPDSAVVVTQEANQLRSVVRVANMAFTNTLVLESNGVLTKMSNLKGRQSRCVFLKR
ncbi:hypothetical protein SHI21_08800 [Bacteriovorax sp. PP10]|uniref:Lipoprotein n=1 Tax=Bacteriovorax antarcticus TaxID=3088717 RepID=A0ABU5VTC5_9BACT|nr:hypothetical protein [Bacteriovorax sp. PP10]MEA9356298.1 hypothetical protein [Bacteriovorax sp. PP10]